MRKAKKNEVKICLPKVPILTARKSIGDTIKIIDTDDSPFYRGLKGAGTHFDDAEQVYGAWSSIW